MKKLYFLGTLLLAGAAAIPAIADSLDINVKDNYDNAKGTVKPDNYDNQNLDPLESMTVDGVAFTFSKASGNNAPALYPYTGDVRLYANNTMTITAPEGKKLEKMTFTMTQEKWYQYGEISADNGSVLCNGGDTDVKVADKINAKPYVWTAATEEGVQTVVFTVANRTFDGEKACQFRFTSVEI